MSTKCLIVDDEPLAIEIIENYLNRLEGYEIVGRCQNALQAFKALETEQVDLLFLDIQMPQLTGIEFLKSIKNAPQVIFTTAYVDYAVESYELDVLDYLVKPISFERFFKAINKFASLSQPEVQKTSPTNDLSEYIFVKENRKNFKIVLNDIRYIESLRDYIRIHTTQRKVVVKTTLTDFEKGLPSGQFLRIHRSFIVNLNMVTAHTTMDVELNDTELPIGVSYKQKVFSVLSN